jgi:hypothetical protein
MNKIQRVSLCLRLFFQFAFVALPVAVMLFWFLAPVLFVHNRGLFDQIKEFFISAHVQILHPLTAIDAIWAFIVSLLPTAVTMTILYFLIRLFKLYEQGEIFTINNVRYLKNIGYTMLVGQLINFVYELLITTVLTINNPAGHKYASFDFGTHDLYNLLTAIMIIVISWVMAEGCKLQEEQKYTV